MVLEVGPNESQAGDARTHRKRAGLVNGGGFVAAQQVEHAVERTQRNCAADIDQFLGEIAAAVTGAGNPSGQFLDFDRRLLWPIGVVRAALAFLERDRVFAETLVRLAIENSQPKPPGVYDDLAANVPLLADFQN